MEPNSPVKVLKVLLIEDDPDAALIIQTQLGMADASSIHFELKHVGSLKDGLQCLITEDFSALLLDLTLPDSYGIETILRVLTAGVDLPILILTASTDERTATEAVSLGAQDYLIKGDIDSRLLKHSIRYAIERKKMVRQLEGIIKGSADGMVVADADWAVQFVNPAAEIIFDKSAKDMLGRAFPCPVPPKKTETWKIPSSGGEEKIAEIRATEIYWKQKPALLMCVRDVTELQRMEQLKGEIRERAHIEKLKDELLEMISQKLEAPFSIAEDALAQLTEGVLAEPLPERQARIIGMVHQNLKRLNKWMSNLTDLSRLELGKQAIRRQPLNLSPLVFGVIQGFRSHAQRQNIELQVDVPEDLPKIYADMDMMVKLLEHLIDNALRYAVKQIGIRARHTGEGLQISVLDDGPEIPEEKLPEMFDKFVQTRRTPAGVVYEGTGLWPAICKEIIALHQGRIWAASSRQGQVQFHCILPEYMPEAASAAEVSFPPASVR